MTKPKRTHTPRQARYCRRLADALELTVGATTLPRYGEDDEPVLHDGEQVFREFSSTPCQLCGTLLAGGRDKVIAFDSRKLRDGMPMADSERTFWACSDCAAYIANGTLPPDSVLEQGGGFESP